MNFKDIKFTKELLAKVETCKSTEELIALAKEKDVELSPADAQKILATLKTELSDEALKQVSGGYGWSHPDGLDHSAS